MAQLAKELGIYNLVDILGWVEGAEKERLLADATVYVLPSYVEGLPMGILEAMAAGLPVIATDVGGIPDAVENGIEGILVQPGDVSAITDAIRMLLSQPGLRARMGKAGRQKVLDSFIPERVLPRLEQIYRDLGVNPKVVAS